MEGLELIQTNSLMWYWWLDYRFADNKDGICKASISYNTDREAIEALASNKIQWEY